MRTDVQTEYEISKVTEEAIKGSIKPAYPPPSQVVKTLRKTGVIVTRQLVTRYYGKMGIKWKWGQWVKDDK